MGDFSWDIKSVLTGVAVLLNWVPVEKFYKLCNFSLTFL